MQDAALGVQDQPAVRAHLGDERVDPAVQVSVEQDGVVPVSQEHGVGLDPVGHVGVAKDPAAQQGVQPAGVVLDRYFQQLEQVDDLVIAPVADVGPGAARARLFPLDAAAGHPVGVVSVGGGGAGKAADHAFHELGVGAGQRLPVLKDVAPVALIVERPRAVRLFDIDREAVPGAAGVAVPAAEGERQVLADQPLQVGRPGARRAGQQLVEVDLVGQRLEKLPAGLEGGPAARRDIVAQAGRGDPVAAGKDAAAHDVKQGVGKVVGRARTVAGPLQAVGAGDQGDELLRAPGDVLLEPRRQPGPVASQRADQRGQAAMVLVHLGHDVPAALFSGGEVEPGVGQVGAAPAAHVGLLDDRLAALKGGHLARGEEAAGAVQPDLPRRGGPQRFARLGQVGQARAEGKDGQAGVRIELAPLVGVEEVAEQPLGLDGDAVGQDVLHAVDQGHRAAVARLVFQPGGLDKPVPVAGPPRVAVGQAQVVVGLFKDQLVAADVLVQAPVHPVQPGVARRERLPQAGPPAPGDQQDRLVPRVAAAGGDLVVGVVGEQRRIGAAPPAGEPAGAGDEQPVVRAADDRHEKGVHAVVISEAIVLLAEQRHVFAADAAASVAIGALADVQGAHGHLSSAPPRGPGATAGPSARQRPAAAGG